MRTFITLEFNRDIKEKIKQIQMEIKRNSLRGRFKYIDNFHLTLKFLGETSREQISKINCDLEAVLKNERKLRVRFSGIGGFGISTRSVKTIYIDTAGNIAPLMRLAESVENVAHENGFIREKRFTPHITIAQEVYINTPFQQLISKLGDAFNEEVEFDRVVIMRSEQEGNKRIYTPINTIYLT